MDVSNQDNPISSALPRYGIPHMWTAYAEIEDALETVDAAIFTGDALEIQKKRVLIKEYSERWLRSISDIESRAKFKVGDKVTVVTFRTESMYHKGYEEYLGRVVTIRKAFDGWEWSPYYYIEGRNDWTWTEDMFE